MTKTGKTNKKLCLPIHVVTYTNGDIRWQVRYQVNGKRTSAVFKMKSEAETASK